MALARAFWLFDDLRTYKWAWRGGGSFQCIPIAPMPRTKCQCGTAATARHSLASLLPLPRERVPALAWGWQQDTPNTLHPATCMLTPLSRDPLPPVTPSALLPSPICFSVHQYFIPFSSPAPGKFRASPGFPGGRTPPAQELCSLLCHEQ